jgi:glycosyltransferase involved in cell wall biosynthesis
MEASALSLAAPSMPGNARRLLVVTYHFPPDGAVGGLRWAGIAKYLARRGWQIAVVTAARPASTEPLRGVHVEWCPRRRTLGDLLRRLTDRTRLVGASTSRPRGTARAPGLLHSLHRELGPLLAFPDESRGWVLRAALRVRSLLRRFEPHVIISSGPPHSAHLAAGLATLGHSAPWFIDLRDPWVGALPRAWANAHGSIARALLPRIERLAFRRARGVITNTEQLAARLAERYPDLAVACVPNGVDPERLPPRALLDPYPGLGIAYAGTLYGSRDLTPVVRALRRFLDRHPAAARAGSKLRFAGPTEAPHALAFRDAVANANLEPYVETIGSVSHAQALTLLSRSRLAVVLAQEQECQVPAKLYESVAMGIPTLIVAEAHSAAALEGARLGGIVRDPTDVAGIAAVLDQLWRDGSRLRHPCPVPITYDAIAALVAALFGENGTVRSAPEYRPRLVETATL